MARHLNLASRPHDDEARMPQPPKPLAILYDFLQVRGGAEAVTLFLRDAFPESTVWVGAVDPAAFPSEMLEGVFSLSAHPPSANAALRAILTAQRFKRASARLNPYGSVLYSGHYAPLAVLRRAQGPNLLYAHAPPLPFALDQHNEYLARCTWWQRAPFSALCRWLRPRYERAVRHMDTVIANSEFVRASLSRHYGVNALVIHPPCRIDDLGWAGQDGYYLSFARLENYKRVDRIIEAFRRLPERRLVVGSEGSELLRLRALAADAPNVEFAGALDRKRLREILGGCIATIHIPRQEPFGISVVESLAAGKPVIGVNEGGIPEIVVDGETGTLLCPDPSPGEIREAVISLPPSRAAGMRSACQSRASRFGPEVFLRRIRKIL